MKLKKSQVNNPTKKKYKFNFLKYKQGTTYQFTNGRNIYA